MKTKEKTEEKTRPLSASAGGKFQSCRRQYEASYILGAEDPPGIPAQVGVLAHKALELAAGRALADSYYTMTKEDARHYVEQAALDERTVDANVVAETLEVLQNAAHRFDFSNTYEAEMRFDVNIEDVDVVGYIDRVDFVEDTATLEIHEYKTGHVVPLKQDLRWAPQTLLYPEALARFPALSLGKNIAMVYHYLRSGVIMRFDYDEAAAMVARTWVANTQAEINKLTEGPSGWPATPSGACAWCPVRDGCEALASWSVDSTDDEASPDALSSPQLVAFRQRTTDRIKVLESRKKEADAELRVRISAGGGEAIHAGGVTAKLATRRKLSYPSIESTALAIAQACNGSIGDIAERIGQVSTTALKRVVAALPKGVQAATLSAAEGTADHGVTTFIDVRRRKSPL